MPDGLSSQLSRGSDAAVLVHDEWIDGVEVEGDDFVTGRAWVGGKRAMCLAPPLVAQECLGLVVADEKRGGGSHLVGNPAKYGAASYRKQASAWAGELEHDRGAVSVFDFLNQALEVEPNQLQCDVPSANEGARLAREVDLNRPRRAQPHLSRRHRIAKLGGRYDEAKHAEATYRREAGVVGEREPSGRCEALDVDRRGVADSGTRNEYVVLGECRGDRVRGAVCRSLQGARVGHGERVVGDRDLGRGLFHPELQALGNRACRGTRQDHLIDLDANELAPKLWVARASCEDLLGHGARRVTSSCAHGFESSFFGRALGARSSVLEDSEP